MQYTPPKQAWGRLALQACDTLVRLPVLVRSMTPRCLQMEGYPVLPDCPFPGKAVEKSPALP